ncbi:MAG: Kae1-associated serine/threonine protein kinase [Thermoplasmata archaeon]|nr:Kae1-associated serine/threonine protein kinase [Thermoplasmata archaeon]
MTDIDSTNEPAGKPVARGAEAALTRVEWLGLAALRKDRDSKAYRPKPLDDRLRKERTRNEARLLREARGLGVRTPIVYDIDLPRHRLVLEELPGPTLKELVQADGADLAELGAPVRSFGEALGRLHAGGMSHGDLTSSNVLYPAGASGAPAFVDLSMGARPASLEERGIDLHLVEEDLAGLHAKGNLLYRQFLEGYSAGNPAGAEEVRQRAKAIKGRIRYA